MKNWLRNKLRNFLNNNEREELIAVCSDRDIRGNNYPDPIRFEIQRASGGTIIDVSYYDRKKDERYQAVHVVPDTEDFHDSLAKIITYEGLKR